jgi:exonuclease III
MTQLLVAALLFLGLVMANLDNNSGQFTVHSANVNSLYHKRSKVRLQCLTQSPDAFLCQETKLDPSVQNETLLINDYTIFREDRCTDRGGGLAIYAKNKFKPYKINLKLPDKIELMAVQLKLGNKPLILVNVYKTPKQCRKYFVEHLNSLLAILSARSENIILCGDVNLCHLLAESHELKLLMHNYDCDQLITQRTHSDRLIDVVYAYRELLVNHTSGLSFPIENVHSSTYVTFDSVRVREPATTNRVWQYSKANWALFTQMIINFNLIGVTADSINVNSDWFLYKEAMLSTAQVCIPKSIKRDRPAVPWCNPRILNLLKKKRKAYAKWKLNDQLGDFHKFSKLRKKCTKAVGAAKRDYYFECFAHINNLGKFWSNYRNTFKPRLPLISLITEDGISLDDCTQIAESLSGHFTNVWNNDDSEPILFAKSSLDSIDHSWFCDVDFVRNSILKLSAKKSVGCDGISASMLKGSIDASAPFICCLINRCISFAEIPSDWKRAIITPVQKKPNAILASDYRPISLLSLVDKIFEKHLVSVLKPYLLGKITEKQFGFLSGRSTNDALMYFDHCVAEGLEKSGLVMSIFFDAAKAFDTVPFNELLRILSVDFGVPEHLCCLLANYVKNRSQYVRVGKECSLDVLVLSGVPQGSVLGPLLFLVYINSVGFLEFSKGCRLIMFADDIALIKPIASVRDLTLLQADVNLLFEHISSKLLTLNQTKTKLIRFARAFNSQKFDGDLLINGTVIEQVASYKYLGVTIDDRLSYIDHTRTVTTKVKRAIGALSKQLSKCVPLSVMSYLFQVLFRSVLTYGIECWYPPTEYGRIMVDKCQKFAARCLLGNFNRDVSYLMLLDKLNWTPIYRLTFKMRMCFIHKCTTGAKTLPTNCVQLMTESGGRHSSRTNHSKAVSVPAHRIDRAGKSAINLSSICYNLLNDDVVSLSYRAFKKGIDSQFDVILPKLRSLNFQVVSVVEL